MALRIHRTLGTPAAPNHVSLDRWHPNNPRMVKVLARVVELSKETNTQIPEPLMSDIKEALCEPLHIDLEETPDYVVASPDGNQIVAVLDDEYVLCDVTKGKIVDRYPRTSSGCKSVGPWFRERVKHYTSKGEHVLKQGDEQVAKVDPCAYLRNSNNCTVVAAALKSGCVDIFNAKTKTLMHRLPCHKPNIVAMEISDDGSAVATRTDDGTVRVWSTATGMCNMVAHDPGTYAPELILSPTGRRLMSIRESEPDNQAVTIWDVKRHGESAVLDVQEEHAYVETGVFSLDETKALIAMEDGMIVVLDAATAQPLASVITGLRELQWVFFGPNADRIIYCDTNGVIEGVNFPDMTRITVQQ